MPAVSFIIRDKLKIRQINDRNIGIKAAAGIFALSGEHPNASATQHLPFHRRHLRPLRDRGA